MRLARVVTVALAVLLGAAFTVSPASAQPNRPHYPVSYRLADAVAAELQHPGAAPIGANDWTCTPGPRHPNPVVLVHGGPETPQLDWQALAPLLANNDYCVFALNYGTLAGLPAPLHAVGGLTPIEQSAHELGTFVDRVLTATGAREADIVDHSEGNLVAGYYVKFLGGADKVSRLVSLGPGWAGTNSLGIAAGVTRLAAELGLTPTLNALVDPICAACLQIQHGSQFLGTLTDGGAAVPGVAYTNIMTRHDEVVLPYTSGYLQAPNAVNLLVQDYCPGDLSDHILLTYDPVAAQLVLDALDPDDAVRPSCTTTPANS
ncbi:lipase family alpha/beta hydrolase [Nocardia transvalensis]|uniref:lipase family alpha/beta hydrolase n=1 Tax=Nocardia transvalensis TaxID=37333 RepID=UPI001892E9FB|nr:alpha/beta fold hydrolase [Nocardia transvalensis]MBF6328313.1 lipase [Nocardia transvalensis]